MRRCISIFALVFVLGNSQSFCQEGAPEANPGKPGPPPPGQQEFAGKPRRPGAQFGGQRRFLPGGRGDDLIVIMGKLRKEKPEEFKRLDALRKSEPEKFIEELKPYIRTSKNGMNKLVRSEIECRKLAGRIRTCKDAEEKEKLTAELKLKLKENFTAMVQDTEERLKRMGEQLETLRKNEEGILEERLDVLLNAPNPPPAPGQGVPPEGGSRREPKMMRGPGEEDPAPKGPRPPMAGPEGEDPGLPPPPPPVPAE